MSGAPLAAAILVGGAGSRLGGARKPLIEIAGRAILDRQIAVLEPLAVALAVVGPEPGPFARDGLALLCDAPGRGPLAGLAAALAWSPAPWLLAIAGDLPFLDRRAIELLAERESGADLVAPRIGDRLQPLLALYRVAATAQVAARLAVAGAGPSALFDRAEAEGLRAAVVSETEVRERLGDLRFAVGVNTEDELDRARRLAAAGD